MSFGKDRIFVNSFSEKLNAIRENKHDGILITVQRFKYYLRSLENRIETHNDKIVAELKKEQLDIQLDMRKQFDVDTELNHFLNLILTSSVVSIYSYFEYTFHTIAAVCEKHLKPQRKIDHYRYGPFIKRYYDFMIKTVPIDKQVLKEEFKEILVWKKVRNNIVHNDGRIGPQQAAHITHKSIEIKDQKIIFHDVDVIVEFVDLVADFLSKLIKEVNEGHQLIEYS